MCPEHDAWSIDSSGVRDGEQRAAVPPQLDGSDAASEDPRTVTTGGKIKADDVGIPWGPSNGIDLDTGEDIRYWLASRGVVEGVRLVNPNTTARAGVALIDALAFTVIPPDEESMQWVMDQMRQFLPIDRVESRNGLFGFKQSVRFGSGAGVIAWGGESQRDRVLFSIQGQGCSLVKDWASLANWLNAHQVKLTRVDLAYDDFSGDKVNVDWAMAEYSERGFTSGGRKPRHKCHGDWLSGNASIHGRTLEVGSRKSGKSCRTYEKGKQLGDPLSRWTRVEVEWHGKDRVLAVEMLTEPGKYLAGAYPCLAFLSVDQARIKTIANSATISFESAVDNARQQFGKLVNLMERVYGGDQGAVLKLLRRDGIPKRIEPYSYHLAESPELLDRDAPGSFAATGDVE